MSEFRPTLAEQRRRDDETGNREEHVYTQETTG
jgi:hypothetical protein